MNLYGYIIRRLFYTIPILVGVTLLIFIIFNVVAGDPTLILLGKYATTAQMAELRHELGLDRPWLVQYLDVLKSAFTFSFGKSWANKQHIMTVIKNSGLVSLTLSIPAFIVSTLLSVSIGLVAAHFRGKWPDRVLVITSVILKSVSALTYILVGQWLLAFKMGWFPISGYEYGFPEAIQYLMMPGILWVVLSIGPNIRFYRTVILDEIYQDYVRTARAKGLSEVTVLFKHVLKNALIPILTNVVTQIPQLILGGILLETFFGIPGLGTVILTSIHRADFPVIKAVTILSAFFFIIFNLLVDVLYRVVDPRVKF